MKNAWICLLAAFTVLAPVAGPARAEESARPAHFDRLRELKERDPEAFTRLVDARKQEIKSRFKEYQQKDPEKFEGLKRQVAGHRVRRLEKLRNENPEKFQQVVKERAGRFEKFRQENPDRYRDFAEKHPKFEEKMGRVRDVRHTRPEGQNPGLRPRGMLPGVRPAIENRSPENESKQEFRKGPAGSKQQRPPQQPQIRRQRPGAAPAGGARQEMRRGPGPGNGNGPARQERRGGPGGARRSRD